MGELHIGDLVLVKVLGFLVWPAKICKPEGLERDPDPEKYLVKFFGTEEIAFVAPEDIQVFTSEAKSKLSARREGKTVSDIAQAIEEICTEFEELQRKSSCPSGEDTGKSLCCGSDNLSPTFSAKKGNSTSKSLKELALASGHSCQSIEECPKGKNAEDELTPKYYSRNPSRVYKQLANEHETALSKKKARGQDEVQNIVNLAGKRTVDVLRNEVVSGQNKTRAFSDISGSETDNNKAKRLRKAKRHLEINDDPQICAENKSDDNRLEFSVGKSKVASGLVEHTSQGNKGTNLTKLSKCAGGSGDVTELVEASRKKDIRSSSFDAKLGSAAVKGSTRLYQVENHCTLKTQTVIGSIVSGEEDVLTQSKCHQRGLKAVSSSAPPPTKQRLVWLCDNDNDNPKTPVHGGTPSFPPVPVKRRCLRLCDDKEDPKTPIHGGSIKKVSAPSYFSDSLQKSNVTNSNPLPAQTLMDLGRVQDGSSKEVIPSIKPQSEGYYHVYRETLEKKTKIPSREVKPILGSPVALSITRSILEPSKPSTQLDKLLVNVIQDEVAVWSNSVPLALDNLNSSQVQSMSEKDKTALSGERKMTLKPTSPMNNSVLAAGNPMEIISLASTSMAASGDDKMPKVDSDISMKHLMSDALAKRRQGRLQNTNDNSRDIFPINADVQIGAPTLTVHSDAHKFHPCPPSSSEGSWGTGGSLIGGYEGAIALDAFKRLVETLSRTKESIGRATRLAIDSAKYGIANEVVGLLIQKLETEPSFSRRVDLFFLVDSITQCSHSHKGIACTSYIPAVQAALPRILKAAAPQGPGAQENRHQCLKVLRLWIERKILPEPLLRHYMDVIGITNDDAAGGFLIGQRFVAERALHDPIRELEGLLVDEYGSNRNFQFAGLLCSNVIKEDGNDLQKVATQVLQVNHTSATGDNTDKYIVAQKDRHTYILEDVDGELEMKDLSRHQNDERPLFTDVPIGRSSNQAESERIIEASSNSYLEFPALPEGWSPALPPGSPPKTPPLPSSPPPPTPPPPPPPPPPPHPISLPPTPSEFHPLYTLPPRPPPLLFSQPSLPFQSSVSLQHVQSVASSVPSSLPMVTYQEPLVPHEVGSIPSGRIIQMAGNVLYRPTPQLQHPLFFPFGVGNSWKPSGYNSRLSSYGHNDACINLQPIQPGQQFQTANAPIFQRLLLPNYPPQILRSSFSHPRLPVQQHPQHPHPALYALPNHPNGPEGFAGGEQSGMQSDFSGGYQLSTPDALPTGGSFSGHGMPCRPDMTALCWRPA